MSETQKEIFLQSEADQFYARNRAVYGTDIIKDEPVVDLLRQLHLCPKKLMEIGCSKGTRLNTICEAFGSQGWGLDPSQEAIADGKKDYPQLSLSVGVADTLPFEDNAFDSIFFGFCLYLCDRKDLFKIVCEADRCLQDNGILIIKDFYPPFPYKNKYAYHENTYSYKMDYSKLFTCNPAYSEMANMVFAHNADKTGSIAPDERITITVLKKSLESAFPDNPFA